MEYDKPLPRIDPEAQPFWDGLKEHRLLFQQCAACGHRQFYPRGYCTNCASDQLNWVESKGLGTVASYTVIYQPFDPAFKDDVPYTVALVDLDEGVRLMSNIVECNPDMVAIGMPVQVRFEPATEDVTLYVFQPAVGA